MTTRHDDEPDLWRPILSYATAIDTKDFVLMREVFTENAVADYGERQLHGPEAVEDRMRLIHGHIHGSRHRLTNFRIVERSDVQAHTITYVDAFLVGGPRDAPWTYRDVGSYHDRLELRDGGWLISHRRYERLWREGDVMALAAYGATSLPRHPQPEEGDH